MRYCFLLCVASVVANAQQAPDLSSIRTRVGGTAYPRAAMDSQGGTVKLAAPAKRIVSLSANTDEYLYQIVPGERIVGVSKSSYDEGFSAVLPHVNKYHPAVVKDLASILALKPELVITSDSMSLDVAGDLKAAGIPIFGIMTTPTDLGQVAANIVALGYVTGADEGAQKELTRYQRELTEIGAQCKAPHGQPRIFGVSMTGFSYGDQTLFQDVMRLIGGANVAAQNGMHTYQRVDAATVASWNPDWVFTWAVPGKGDQEMSRWMEDDPGLRNTSAAKQHRISVSEAKDVLPLSPLITKFIRTMADATCSGK